MEKATELFSERGYGSVGINEVGQTAGFGKGALYYHIRSKEDLLISIISEHMERLIANAEDGLDETANFEERINGLSQAFAEELLRNHAAMTICYRDVHAIVEPDNVAIVDDLYARYRAIWVTALDQGTKAGEHRSIDATEIDAFVGLLFASVFWVKSGARADILANTFSRTILGAVLR